MNNKNLLSLVTLAGLAILTSQSASASINAPIVSVVTNTGFVDLFSDNPLAVSFSDNVRMSVAGAPSGGGNNSVEATFAGINAILPTVVPGRITISVEGQRTVPGSVSVALYNWQADTYVNIGTMAGFGSSDAIRRVVTTSPRRFINGFGAIRVRLRSTSRANHRLKLDHVKITID